MSSKFITNPPKIQLRDKDNLPGKNPTIAKTGDKRTGVFPVAYNDERTILFHTGVQVNYPQLLDPNSEYILSGTVLTTTGNVIKGISDSVNVVFSQSDPGWGPFCEVCLPEQNTTSFFATGTSESILPGFSSPLKSKTKIEINISTAQEQVFGRYSQVAGDVLDPGGPFAGQDLTGFCYFNFNTLKWEQIGLTDPQTGAPVLYHYAVENAAPGSRIALSGTGNFPLQFLPANGNIEDEEEIRMAQSYPRIGTPTISAFAPFSNKYHATSSQRLRMSNYINHPFLLEKVVVEIPVTAEKKANHFFDDDPFRLEQEDYVFFIYRQQQSEIQQPNFGSFSQTIGQDFDSFVSASHRYLVCSGAMTFYNNVAATALPTRRSYEYRPLNTPAWSHDWGIDPNTTGSNVAVSASFTGSVQINIKTAVASAQMLGHHKIPRSVNSPGANNHFKMWNYWPGGTSCLPFGPTGSHGKGGIQTGIGIQTPWNWLAGPFTDNNGFGEPTYKAFAVNPNVGGPASFQGAKQNLPIEKIDGRARNPLGGVNSLSDQAAAESAVAITGQQSVVSPYLLLPTDELVFGMEAVRGKNGRMTANALTSSLMRIMPGEARVTLYGSLLRRGQEFHQGLNQDLTSENVTEFLHFDNPVVDQFDIIPREAYGGSQRDAVMIGRIEGQQAVGSIQSFNQANRFSIFPDSYFVRAFTSPSFFGDAFFYDLIVTNEETPPSTTKNGTLEFPRRKLRFLQLTSLSERFYDTLLPDIGEYMQRAGAVKTGSYVYASAPAGISDVRPLTGSTFVFKKDGTDSNNIITLDTGGGIITASRREQILEVEGNHMPYVYEGNPNRVLVQKKTNLVLSGVQTAGQNYRERVIQHGDGLRWILFGWGFRASEEAVIGMPIDADQNQHLEHKHSGSMGYRYGVQGIFPRSSRLYFRPNRYGQFRDMLEQRRDGTFFDEIGIAADGTVTGRTGKKSSPVTARFVRPNGRFVVGGGRSVFSGSSNRSGFATSSLPYFDGEFRNWDIVT